MDRANVPHPASRLLLDIVPLGFIAVLLLLAVVFPARVPGWQHVVPSLGLAGFLYAAVSRFLLPRLTGFPQAVVHAAAVLTLFSFLFRAVSEFQLVFISEWKDGVLVSWENAMTGTESTRFLERFVSPMLTEWMMFAYVLYMPLLPLIALASYRTGGHAAITEYLLHFSLANVLCYLGFMLFPVAGPLCYSPAEYTTHLDGGIFTWMGEWIRANMHYPGGCLPSPHCAVATVMIVALFRYNRKLLALLLPPLASIYVATVYGRYHYVWDSIAGILVAILVIRLSPVLARLVDRTTASVAAFNNDPLHQQQHTQGGGS